MSLTDWQKQTIKRLGLSEQEYLDRPRGIVLDDRSTVDHTFLIKSVNNKLTIKRDNNGNFKGYAKTPENFLILLDQHPDWTGVFKLNIRTNKILVSGSSHIEDGHLTNDHLTWIREWFSVRYSLQSAATDVKDFVYAIANKHQFDPILDYLNRVYHEHKDTDNNLLNYWLYHACGVDIHDDISRVFGRKWLISAVARQFDPGCKVDTALVLQGEQGLQKSTLLQELAVFPEYFNDGIKSFDSKDTLQILQGPFIIELSEIDKFYRKSDASSIKTFFTTQIDTFRDPYSIMPRDCPRRCVFAGTTNHDEFLCDETGGRRFWPIKVSKCNIDWVRKNRDKLWAEAVKTYIQLTNGGTAAPREYAWWLSPKEEKQAQERQEGARMKDAWEDVVENYLEGRGKIDLASLFRVLELPRDQWSRNTHRLSRVVLSLGWRKSPQPRGRELFNGIRTTVYYSESEYKKYKDSKNNIL